MSGNRRSGFATDVEYLAFRSKRNAAQRAYRLRHPQLKKRDPNKVVTNRAKERERYYTKKRERALQQLRSTKLRVRYNMTVEEYDSLFESQQGKCAICESPPMRYRLAVDHCHSSGKNRGLLCSPCNTGLGALENFEWRQKAEAYLEKHNVS